MRALRSNVYQLGKLAVGLLVVFPLQLLFLIGVALVAPATFLKWRDKQRNIR